MVDSWECHAWVDVIPSLSEFTDGFGRDKDWGVLSACACPTVEELAVSLYPLPTLGHAIPSRAHVLAVEAAIDPPPPRGDSHEQGGAPTLGCPTRIGSVRVAHVALGYAEPGWPGALELVQARL